MEEGRRKGRRGGREGTEGLLHTSILPSASFFLRSTSASFPISSASMPSSSSMACTTGLREGGGTEGRRDGGTEGRREGMRERWVNDKMDG